MFNNFKVKIVLITILFLIFPFIVSAATLGETKNFYIDSSYDISGRKEVNAALRKINSQLYIYIDDSWWQGLSSLERGKIDSALTELASEFERKIYPTLTSTFGFEWKPGIDNDERITVLFHPMRRGAGGYFNNGNEYPKLQNPNSNEREMIYLNTDYISSSLAKSFLAHEFGHLITFNQKDKMRGVEEEIWLNEARAEYAPTLIGYDSPYQESNLQKRVKEFLNNPSDSITDWQGSSADYGALNLFTQYLVDHYGIKILIDSLHSQKKGIESINYALTKNGFKEDFAQIFTDWTIAIFVNDCSLGPKYCYKNENLKNLRIIASSNFLPTDSQSSLSVSYITKEWSGNWHKIFGGKGTLIFEFRRSHYGNFNVPYVLCDFSGKCFVNFMELDANQSGKITISDFNKKYSSITVIPVAKETREASVFSFSWNIRTVLEDQQEETLKKQLLEQIEVLKAEVARLQTQIDAILGKVASCAKLENNLYFGLKDNQEVCCLQEFLKKQDSDIYPEGLVTGNFLTLTRAAVIRFQEKYTSEILAPFGLSSGTGYVGSMTRTKINQIGL